jgi:hypothetical protein
MKPCGELAGAIRVNPLHYCRQSAVAPHSAM